MSCNDFGFIVVQTQKFTCPARYIAVTGAMKTVPANTVFFIQGVRNSVHIGMFGHGLMKSRIENRHLRNLWQQVADSKNTCQIRRIVKGSYFYTGFNIPYHFVGNYHTGVKFFASMHYTMPYGINFFHVFDTTVFSAGKHTQYVFYCKLMFKHFAFKNNFFSVLFGMFKE